MLKMGYIIDRIGRIEMRVILLKKNQIDKVVLPEKCEGVFCFLDDNNDTIINIEGTGSAWIVKQNDETSITVDGNLVGEAQMVPFKYYELDYLGEKLLLYVEPTVDGSIAYYSVEEGKELNVGSTNDCAITNNCQYFKNPPITLKYENSKWSLKTDDNTGVYINGFTLNDNYAMLSFGDSIFIYGLRIYLYKGIIAINNPNSTVNVDNTLTKASLKMYNSPGEVPITDAIKEVNLYSDKDYFFKTPRMRRFVEKYDYAVAAPPQKEKPDETPLIIKLGPSLTVGIVSIITTIQSFQSILSNSKTWQENLLPLISAVAMLASSLIWPRITSAYDKKRTKKKEKIRQEKYGKYLEKKEKDLKEVNDLQRAILTENLITTKECENIILNKTRNLWERRNDQRDFLTVRVGVGTVPLNFETDIHEEEFEFEEDELKNRILSIVNKYKEIPSCPVGYSFNGKRITAIMGAESETKVFLKDILIQLLSFHSYDDLKLVFFISKRNLGLFDQFKDLPHCFSNDKQVRFFGTNEEEYAEIDKFLFEELANRVSNNDAAAVESESDDGSSTFVPHYVIITDEYPLIRKLNTIANLLEIKDNVGFSLVCLENRLSKLPSQCEDYIMIDQSSSILCTNINNYNVQEFTKEIDNTIDVSACANVLCNVPIEFTFDLRHLPTSLGFLEMFNVGKVEQLNTLNRWRLNEPMTSLRARVGINDEGNPIFLDLHEKFHGPHGLIAGTTGSGKSEFIITYVLSMVVNYNPNEVAFILIDYKGGGLAGAFENKNLGLKLPHLAGTITNLDKASLNRTLVSINSELQRRQIKFNEVREQLGESTIDIYKYQRLFREGKIKEPMPHLFIVSDEFAELKAQQPDFMDDLVSAARIGRSLGIHLILATQKPSGVVSGQIWSNSKFKVCLKVQEPSDSSEMIQKPDAAYLTNAGRFYLQVGNDELYVLGQSGWTGTNYIGAETVKRKYDRSVSFINNVGQVIKNNDGSDKKNAKDKSKGDELSNVLRYVCDLAKKENMQASSLWLDAIPAEIYVADLIKKYNYKPEGISALVGEFDAPQKQYQGALSFRFDEAGNMAIYGNTSANREMFLGTMIYSLCTTYSPEDINIYIADFGSESLRLYERFPQVGDIVYVNEADKFTKLINLLYDEVKTRKELFADYNGEYKLYNKNSGSKVPLKMFILNNVDSFKENYSSIEDAFITLSRECERYGIVLVFATSSLSTIEYKMRRNIHNIVALDFQDVTEYMDIFDISGKIYPAEYEGRGVICKDALYEFQTAQVTNPDDLVEFVKAEIAKQKEKYPVGAPSIPVLPDVITPDMFDKDIKDINKLPIGMNTETLKKVYYNFFADPATVITSKEVGDCKDFIQSIIYCTKKLNQMTVLVDPEKVFADLGGMVNTYVNDHLSDFIVQFEQFLDSKIDGRDLKVLCILSGFDKLRNDVDPQTFEGFFRGVKTFENVRLIFVDSSYAFNDFSFDEWFKSSINSQNGIWIGSGFDEQNVISATDINGQTRAKLSKQFAWVAKKGEAELIKIAGDVPKEDDENEE